MRFEEIGPQWSAMARELGTGRTPTQVKNRWAVRIRDSPTLAEAIARGKHRRDATVFEGITSP
jgi:hypothetical protein